MAIPPISTEELPVLETVTVLLELSPIVPPVNVSAVGDSVKWRGSEPVPERLTVCDPPRLPASSFSVSCPTAGPATVGANDTLAVQLAPGGRLLGQLSVSTNWLLAKTLEKFSGLPPKLLIVTGCDVLEVPISWMAAKVKAAGETLIAEGRGLDSGSRVAPKT